jgi:hypothetical protein
LRASLDSAASSKAAIRKISAAIALLRITVARHPTAHAMSMGALP